MTEKIKIFIGKKEDVCGKTCGIIGNLVAKFIQQIKTR